MAYTIASASEDILESILHNNEVTIKPHNNPVEEYHCNTIPANEPIEDTHAELILPNGALFGVFDGHTGTAASYFLKDKFLKEYILPEINKVNINTKSVNQNTIIQISDALTKAFLKADKDFLETNKSLKNFEAGAAGACTIIAYILHTESADYLFIANAGDCRAVVGKGVNNNVTPVVMSRDHTAKDPKEIERLKKEHPNEPDVVNRGRVKGSLEPSRGIGDGIYKDLAFNMFLLKKEVSNWHPPYTTAEPEITVLKLETYHKFIVIATDGLWMWFNNDEIVNLIASLNSNPKIPNIATNIIRNILTERLHGKSLFELPARTRRRYYDDTTITYIKLNIQPRVPQSKL